MATLFAGDARTATIASLSLCGAAVAVYYAKRSTVKLPLPPGPSGLPLIGNALDIPAENFWLKYKEWSDQYGSDVIYLNIMGNPVVVLNSLAACKELLETRSSIYSSRPNMPMMNELIGFDWHFGFMPYGDEWKERRKMFQQVFHPTRTEFYRPKLLKAVRNFLIRLLDDPKDYFAHCRLLAGAFILDVTYGIDVKNEDDIYIAQAERGMAAMAAAGTASSYMVDFFPSLKYLPSWLPGAQFQREAKAWRKDVTAMPRDCLRFVEDGLASPSVSFAVVLEILIATNRNGGIPGRVSPPYCSKSLKNMMMSMKRRREPFMTYLDPSGSDTTVSSFKTFFLAMAQNPDIQKKAQGVVDKVVSELGRLPDFTEYGTLPYIEALVREVLRWRPVTPIAVPHKLTQDDVYHGYHIPAGSTILPNAWAIAHDPALYGPNPGVFDPPRFMNASQTEINHDMPMGYEAFGYGRRICPGLHIAVESVWLFAVSVLAAFDVKPADGESESEDFGKYTSGMLIHPYPFELRIVPRDPDVEAMVRSYD
ncbi:hypothetical protein EST38_g4984 [Candolleomyces aberdarensis]|uniref:Cytochrome P450 n=1 Tax=Candolleomyces aberdarensis TaxID=2316362 RepID=A0A4Q2DNY6_9AGAR|nr:hypothetical protein EST38_g4984 [Candolleomyces aberdarensis]